MSKYLDRISQDEKSKKSAANLLAEAHAKAEVEQTISKLKSKKATLAAASESALSASPFNVERVFSLAKETAENTANLALAEKLLTEEFSD